MALWRLPAACEAASEEPCGIHVHYHGCELYYPHWSAMHLGLHEWAEANHLVVLHPRVRWTEYEDWFSGESRGLGVASNM